MITFLESNRIILSVITESDLEGDYLFWINNQESDIYTQHALFPINQFNLKEYFLSKIKNKNNTIWLGIFIKDSKKHIGNIEIYNINWVNKCAEFSILIGDNSSKGVGYGFEATNLILSHVFKRLNLNRIQLGVEVDNLNAIKLYKKVGFKEEGILRESICKNSIYKSTFIMSILREEYKYD